MPMIKREDFIEPKSLAEAEDRELKLIAEIQEIQAQLGNPLTVVEYENEADFHEWRRRTKWAQTLRLQELRILKLWIRDRNRQENNS